MTSLFSVNAIVSRCLAHPLREAVWEQLDARLIIRNRLPLLTDLDQNKDSVRIPIVLPEFSYKFHKRIGPAVGCAVTFDGPIRITGRFKNIAPGDNGNVTCECIDVSEIIIVNDDCARRTHFHLEQPILQADCHVRELCSNFESWAGRRVTVHGLVIARGTGCSIIPELVAGLTRDQCLRIKSNTLFERITRYVPCDGQEEYLPGYACEGICEGVVRQNVVEGVPTRVIEDVVRTEVISRTVVYSFQEET